MTTTTSSSFWGSAQFRYLIFAGIFIATLLNRYEVTLFGYSPRIEHLAAIVVIPFFGLALWGDNRLKFQLNAPILLFTGWILVNILASILNAPDTGESLVLVLRLMLIGSIFYVSIYLFAAYSELQQVFLLWVILGIAEALIGILAGVSAFAFDTSFGVQRVPAWSDPRIYGTLLESNIYASFIGALSVALLTVILWKRQNNQAIERWLYAGLFIAIAGMIFSGTRAAWVATAGGSILPLLIFRNMRTARFGVGLLGAAVVVGVIVTVAATSLDQLELVNDTDEGRTTTVGNVGNNSQNTTQLDERFESFGNLGNDDTFSGRLEDWERAINDWQKNPIIGNGTGSFGQIHGELRGGDAWISNWVLHLLTDTGLIGTALFLAMLGIVAYQAFLVFWRQHITEQNLYLIALCLGMTVLLVAYLATSAVWLAAFWVHLGLIIAFLRTMPTSETAIPSDAA